MENKVDTVEASEEKSGGKIYHPPHLITYGNIREVTQNVGATGKNDSSPPIKTGF